MSRERRGREGGESTGGNPVCFQLIAYFTSVTLRHALHMRPLLVHDSIDVSLVKRMLTFALSLFRKGIFLSVFQELQELQELHLLQLSMFVYLSSQRYTIN